MRRVLSYTRRAVDDYKMIESGDKIAVGVSGGKDSLTLLAAMKALQRFYPLPFELEAITLDMGLEGMDFSPIKGLCAELGVPFSLKKTNIGEILFDIRKEQNPCSLCANLRRGALNELALELGCRKVALGHHNDDVTETFMMSLLFEGRVSCFSPVTYLDRRDITVIRPFVYMPEKEIEAYVRRSRIEVVHNPCPANGHTMRQYTKELIAGLELTHCGVRERLFTAMKNDIEKWKIHKTKE